MGKERNPYHLPAGTSEGGQFTTAPMAAAAWKAAGLGTPIGAKTYEEYKLAAEEALAKAAREHTWFGDTDDLSTQRLYAFMHEEDSHLMQAVIKLQEYAQQEGITPEEYIASVEEHYKQELSESDVYMRITNAGLKKALNEEEFKNTFMTGRTKAGFSSHGYSYAEYAAMRDEGEARALGIASDYPAEYRPIYGYWSKDSNGGLEAENDSLEQYGSIAIKFKKENISDSLTFTNVDSLDNSFYVRSSDWRSPSYFSSIIATSSPDSTERIFNDTPGGFRYWEAQIFDRSISNIEEVIFYTGKGAKVQAETTKLLDKKGIVWRIVNP